MNNKKEKINKFKILICVLGCLIFLTVFFLMIAGKTEPFDTFVWSHAIELRNNILNRILVPVTYMGDWFSITPLIIFLIVLKETRKDIGIPAGLTAASSTVIYKIIKTSIARPRPPKEFFLISQGGFSFPSGHSMNGLVAYGIIIWLIRKKYGNKKWVNIVTFILTLLIITIGLSRIYVGVHYVSDVIAGWSLGAAYLSASEMVITKVLQIGEDEVVRQEEVA